MRIAIIRYAKVPKHEHFFKYNKDSKKWEFLICETEGSWACSATNSSLPRGTKFDAYDSSGRLFDRYPGLD